MSDIKDEKIKSIRKHVDRVDSILLHALAERLALMPNIAKYKHRNNIPITDERREIEMINKYKELAKKHELDPNFVEEFFLSIINESKRIQSGIIKKIEKGEIIP